MSSHNSQEDESYFISMTDLMVGMLFIFIILLMAFALNLKEQETKLTQTDTASNEMLRDLKEQKIKLTQTDTARNEMLRDIAEALKNKGIPVIVLPESGVLRLPEKVLFDVGRADLQPTGIFAIEKLSEALAETLPCYAGKITPKSCGKRAFGRLESVFIEGHTDNQTIAGNPNGNWQLSTQRAITVYRTLTATNLLFEQLQNDKNGQQGTGEKLIGVSGYADQRPAMDNNTPQGMQANRRIDLRFIMAIPNHDGAYKINIIINSTENNK